MRGMLCRVAGAALVVAALPASAQAAQELVVAGWSGGYDVLLEEVMLPECLAEMDVDITWVLGNSASNIAKVRAAGDNQEIDVVIADDLPQRAAMNEGLWAALDPAIVTNLANVRDVARLPDDQGVGFALNISGLVYHPDALEAEGIAPPTSWNDLFREEFAGRIALMPATAGEGLITLIQLAYMNGGSEADIGPGFDAIAEIAADVLEFPSTGAQVTSLFQREEAWISVMPLDYAAIVKQEGVPIEFVFPEEGAPARTYTISVVKGAPHPELAQQLVNCVLSETVQQRVATELQAAPVIQEVDVPADILDMADRVYAVDMDAINANREAWIERWNREIETR